MTAPTDRLASLAVDGTVVATYNAGTSLNSALAPRPYLHPVTTLGGVLVTDAVPGDHPWHLGVAVAIQDVGGVNVWGGRSYVRDVGYTWPAAHGRVVHEGWETARPDHLVERLTWLGPDRAPLLAERREQHCAALHSGWVLHVAFTLTDSAGTGIDLGSPGSNGRVGGGYGGFFWRLPASTEICVRAADGRSGEELVHGRPAPWIGWTARSADGAPYTLVAVGRDDGAVADPWFVRVTGYPGFGSALAFERPVVLGPHGAVRRSFSVAVLDGLLDREQMAQVHDEIVARGNGAA